MDRSKFPQGPHVNRDLSRSRSQVIRSYWVHLWCSPSAGCTQWRWQTIKGVCSSPAQLVVCVQRVGTISGLSAFSLFGWKSELSVFESFFFRPVSIHFVCPPIRYSWYTFGFWVQCYLLVYHFDRISKWRRVLFPPQPFRNQGTSLLWTLCDLCSALLASQPATWGNVTVVY